VIAEIVVLVSCLVVFALTKPVTILGGMEKQSADMCFHMVMWITIVKPFVWTMAFIPGYGLRAAGDVRFSMITSCFVVEKSCSFFINMHLMLQKFMIK
jgi:Na+-driven multidrug efflux pump